MFHDSLLESSGGVSCATTTARDLDDGFLNAEESQLLAETISFDRYGCKRREYDNQCECSKWLIFSMSFV